MQSESVAGMPATISSSTLVWVWYEIRSPVKSFFIIERYWAGSGSSKPHSSLMLAISCASPADFSPAIRAAGSELGITLKIRKTITETAKRTTIIPSTRLAAKRAIRSRSGSGSKTPACASTPILDFGSSASRRQSPNTFSERTERKIISPGAIVSQGAL